ncbi:MAG TPA: thermonuclease family protein [Steroidobacteraceae bacterium]|nr:thermonuclease family protein [Steroidobacteraceae bacterium]
MKTRPWSRPPRAAQPSNESVVRWLRAALCAAGLLGSAAAVAQVASPDDAPAERKTIPATVTKVNDGDSLEVTLDVGGPARVRLSAIDTPEYDQPYGAQSSAAMKALLPVGTKIRLDVITQDQFHRLVAVVWLEKGDGRININEKMLSDGQAWAYRRYMKEPRFCDIEADARDHKRGLWALPVSDWIYPPEWRSLKNGEIRLLPTPYAETKEKCLEVLKLAGAATYTPP